MWVSGVARKERAWLVCVLEVLYANYDDGCVPAATMHKFS
jgi:hypothetical protein